MGCCLASFSWSQPPPANLLSTYMSPGSRENPSVRKFYCIFSIGLGDFKSQTPSPIGLSNMSVEAV